MEEDSGWAGCDMEKICDGDFTFAWNVPNLIGWANGIHHWGFTVHGLSILDDVEVCMKCGADLYRTPKAPRIGMIVVKPSQRVISTFGRDQWCNFTLFGPS